MKMTENMGGIWPKNVHNDKPNFLNLTKIHDTDKHWLYPKKYAGAVGLDRSPNPGTRARTGWDTCPASLTPSLRSSTRKKKHQAWRLLRTPDVALRLRFIIVNFGQIQLFSVKFIWSFWFGQVYNPPFSLLFPSMFYRSLYTDLIQLS